MLRWLREQSSEFSTSIEEDEALIGAWGTDAREGISGDARFRAILQYRVERKKLHSLVAQIVEDHRAVQTTLASADQLDEESK